MDIIQVVQELYRLRIDCGLETYQGSGVTAWVVNERNSRVEKQFHIDDLETAAEWLLTEASRQREPSNSLEHDPHVHALLAELANSYRKDPKKVSPGQRDNRLQASEN
ncbi:MAG: hypothetical protein ABW034_15670 [Steroidobacteraceae bacterium]